MTENNKEVKKLCDSCFWNRHYPGTYFDPPEDDCTNLELVNEPDWQEEWGVDVDCPGWKECEPDDEPYIPEPEVFSD